MQEEKVILLVEDNPSELDAMEDLLSAETGYTIRRAMGIAEAQELVESLKEEIDCIIFDLNMSNDFLPDMLKLSPEEVMEITETGSLTGWVWFCCKAIPLIKKTAAIIVFSAFVNELRAKKRSLTHDCEHWKYFDASKMKKNIVYISKGDGVNNIKKLPAELQELLKKRA
jgi:CheY-like chemotaxis protein